MRLTQLRATQASAPTLCALPSGWKEMGKLRPGQGAVVPFSMGVLQSQLGSVPTDLRPRPAEDKDEARASGHFPRP